MRRRRAPKRDVRPDAKYNSQMVEYLINVVMRCGKKATAQKIVYEAFDIVARQTNQDPVEVFEQALDNARPLVEVKSRRVGGTNYQVPVEIATERQVGIAIRWFTNFAKGRKGKPMGPALAAELLDAYNRTGSAVKKREDTHRMAQANRAFAHYRW